MLRQAQGVGDATFALLVGITQMLEPEILAVPQQLEKIPCAIAARHQHDFRDAGVDERLDRVVDHRLVIDRQQMFIRHFSERKQSRTETSRKHDTLHPAPPTQQYE